MSEVSIFGKKWIDLVFEGRNKSYGAYQLRNENPRTTLTALFVGILFMGSLGGGCLLLSSFGVKPTPITIPEEPPIIVHLSDVEPPAIKPPAPKILTTPPATNSDTKNLVNPVVVAPVEPTPNIAPNNQPVVNNPAPTEGGTGTAPSATPATPGTNPTAAVTSNSPYRRGALDVLPKFPGGIEKFYKYIGENFRKPSLENGAAVTVSVSFVIETDGSLSDIKVIQNPGNGLDKEAIRLLKALKTKWQPGIKDGKPVRTLYSLPITIVPE